jgi:hypothetical protein
MATMTEARRTGEFIISEANGTISRDEVTIVSGQNLAVGTVVGKITASGKYTAYDDDNADGSQTAAGILYAAVDATAGDKKGVIIARHAEVDTSQLVFVGTNDAGDITAGKADLAALAIILR